MSNPRLQQLHDYPFVRLNRLLNGLEPAADKAVILASIGEPRLPLADFVAPALHEAMAGFGKYPPTAGDAELRQAMANWLQQRYELAAIDAPTQVLSANGTREALFAIAHAMIDPQAASYVLMPNPMYQIYYGAAVTAGARPFPVSCTAATGFAPDWASVPEHIWQQTALVYLCSPGNPTGWVATAADYRYVLTQAERYGFIIVSDECYSEIYRQQAPVGLLQVATAMGNTDFRQCVVMNSLSKRSALPGLRCGLIAGDAEILKAFLKWRGYSGAATPLPLQHVAATAWRDEAHVEHNLKIYQQSMAAFGEAMGGRAVLAEGGFFCWLAVDDGEAFARRAWAEQAVKLLPGAYLSVADAHGSNPGDGYVRVALVDGVEQSAELGARLSQLYS